MPNRLSFREVVFVVYLSGGGGAVRSVSLSSYAVLVMAAAAAAVALQPANQPQRLLLAILDRKSFAFSLLTPLVADASAVRHRAGRVGRARVHAVAAVGH